ncbi:9618_t:CDS:2 [Cetraspora pellucida]|uniref:9618_t:CDS:1 n=1 Tax=Cetraspora pellucida TaxID=1433469 RepID=A0A9N9IMF1_9GLOM|nr:9618_t:CDS:2 [Cetraspora pellucida]
MLTNNGSNIKAAFRHHLSHIINIPCVAHTFQLSIKQGIIAANSLIKKAKALIDFFEFNKQLECLKEAQQSLHRDTIYEIIHDLQSKILNDNEWKMLYNLIHLLYEFEQATALLGGSNYRNLQQENDILIENNFNEFIIQQKSKPNMASFFKSSMTQDPVIISEFDNYLFIPEVYTNLEEFDSIT